MKPQKHSTAFFSVSGIKWIFPYPHMKFMWLGQSSDYQHIEKIFFLFVMNLSAFLGVVIFIATNDSWAFIKYVVSHGRKFSFSFLCAFIFPNDPIENCCQKPCRCTVLHFNCLPGYNLVDNHNHLARWKSTIWMISQVGCLCATSSESAGYKIETICEMEVHLFEVWLSVFVPCILKHSWNPCCDSCARTGSNSFVLI